MNGWGSWLAEGLILERHNPAVGFIYPFGGYLFVLDLLLYDVMYLRGGYQLIILWEGVGEHQYVHTGVHG